MGLPVLFRDAAGGPPAITGSGGSTFSFSDAATGQLVFSGSGGSSFTFASAATGTLGFTGTGASVFSFSDAATGQLVFSGAGGSAFDLGSAGAGEEVFAGPLASTFGFASGANGHVTPPPGADQVESFKTVAPGWWPIQKLQRVPRAIRAMGGSSFGADIEARGEVVLLPAIDGAGGSAFWAAWAAQGVVDERELALELDDEAWLLGIDDRDLVST